MGIFSLSYMSCGFAQDMRENTPTKSQILSPAELNKINQAPIAETVKVQSRVEGKSSRELIYDAQDANGTRIREYREKDQPREIQVDSSMGTHYQMSPPMQNSPSTNTQKIDRVPSLQVPF